jgi:hypothetical protein
VLTEALAGEREGIEGRNGIALADDEEVDGADAVAAAELSKAVRP